MLGPGNISLSPEDSPVRCWSPLRVGELSPVCVIEPESAQSCEGTSRGGGGAKKQGWWWGQEAGMKVSANKQCRSPDGSPGMEASAPYL